jgi:hypothetical protein
MHGILLSFPRSGDSAVCGSGRDEDLSGGNYLRLIQNPFSDGKSAKNLTCSSMQNRGLESPIQVRETQPAFHPPTRRNACHCRDVRQQSRFVRPVRSKADTQPQLCPALQRLSAMISQCFTRAYGLFRTVCGAALLTSSCALTFCRPALSAAISFRNAAMVVSCCSFFLCSLRNSLSNIALICW